MKRLTSNTLIGYLMDVGLMLALLWGGLSAFATTFDLSCDATRLGVGLLVLGLVLPAP